VIRSLAFPLCWLVVCVSRLVRISRCSCCIELWLAGVLVALELVGVSSLRTPIISALSDYYMKKGGFLRRFIGG